MKEQVYNPIFKSWITLHNLFWQGIPPIWTPPLPLKWKKCQSPQKKILRTKKSLINLGGRALCTTMHKIGSDLFLIELILIWAIIKWFKFAMRSDFYFSPENSFSLFWIDLFKLTHSVCFLSFTQWRLSFQSKRNLTWSENVLPSIKELFAFKWSLLLLRYFLGLICLPWSMKHISDSLHKFRNYLLTSTVLLFHSSIRRIIPEIVTFFLPDVKLLAKSTTDLLHSWVLFFWIQIICPHIKNYVVGVVYRYAEFDIILHASNL